MKLALLPLFIIGIPFAIALFAFWIWMLVSAIQNKGLTNTERIVWVLVIIFCHFLGSLLYLVIGRPKRKNPLTLNATV